MDSPLYSRSETVILHFIEVMHGSNAPLLGRIIQNQMEKIKSGEPFAKSISLEDAVPGEQTIIVQDLVWLNVIF